MPKKIINIVLSVLLLVVTLPITIIVAVYLLIRGRDIIAKKTYCCKNCKHFEMYSFNLDASSDDNNVKFSNILRGIPALLNVLAGDMSIVGPSVITPEEYTTAKSLFPDYEILVSCNPGIISEAALFLPKINTPESFISYCECNAKYIRNQSVIHDIEIVADSILIIICGK